MVIDGDAIHSVAITYCGCRNSPDPYSQLLEIGWWPASTQEPQTVATFEALRRFHVINLRGHLSPTDYYRAIEELTDGTGLHQPPVSYTCVAPLYFPELHFQDRLAQFMLILRQWRNIKEFKRFGRGHDPTGIPGTAPRSLIVPCRPCPHPDINLPDNWRDAAPSKRYALEIT